MILAGPSGRAPQNNWISRSRKVRSESVIRRLTAPGPKTPAAMPILCGIFVNKWRVSEPALGHTGSR